MMLALELFFIGLLGLAVLYYFMRRG